MIEIYRETSNSSTTDYDFTFSDDPLPELQSKKVLRVLLNVNVQHSTEGGLLEESWSALVFPLASANFSGAVELTSREDTIDSLPTWLSHIIRLELERSTP